MMQCIGLCVIGVLVFLSGCSSTPPDGSSSEILEPVKENGAVAPDPAPSTNFLRLQELLIKLGYEGVGLAFESDESLQLLTTVFSDPRVANRQIRLVYTGLQMVYDAKYQSLTIGGTTQSSAIIDFIQKDIPLRPADSTTSSAKPK